MNIWQTLEIEPTSDVSVIKKAYAKKLRIYHPEDDPEGYQLLREAYDSALKYVKNNEIGENDNIIFSKDVNKNTFEEGLQQQTILGNCNNGPEFSELNLHKLRLYNETADLKSDRIRLVNEFFNNAEALYNRFFDRLEKKNWEELLNNEILWDIDYIQIINERMLGFLQEHHYFPQDIWHLLNDSFNFNEQRNHIESNYPKVFVMYMYKQISNEIVPRYCYFKPDIEIDFDLYLKYREDAFKALLSNDLEVAKYKINQALEIFSKDPDLLCMYGEYNFLVMNKDMASDIFKSAIDINPDDGFIYLYQVQLMHKSMEYNKAIKICEAALRHRCNNLQEIRDYSIEWYLSNNDLRKAAEILLYDYPINAKRVEYLKKLEYNLELGRMMAIVPGRMRYRKYLHKVHVALKDNKEYDRKELKKDILKIALISLSIICVIAWLCGVSYGPLIILLIEAVYFIIKKKL